MGGGIGSIDHLYLLGVVFRALFHQIYEALTNERGIK